MPEIIKYRVLVIIEQVTCDENGKEINAEEILDYTRCMDEYDTEEKAHEVLVQAYNAVF